MCVCVVQPVIWKSPRPRYKVKTRIPRPRYNDRPYDNNNNDIVVKKENDAYENARYSVCVCVPLARSNVVRRMSLNSCRSRRRPLRRQRRPQQQLFGRPERERETVLDLSRAPAAAVDDRAAIFIIFFFYYYSVAFVCTRNRTAYAHAHAKYRTDVACFQASVRCARLCGRQ